jgi:hypothetical protein
VLTSDRLRARVNDETLTLSIWAVSLRVFPWLRSCRAASVLDGVIVRGRPPSRPGLSPALIRSDSLDRSYSARDANMSKINLPCVSAMVYSTAAQPGQIRNCQHIAWLQVV